MTVVWAFDTLGYSKRLREAGVPNPQAEGHAEAAREFIMIELATKHDLQATERRLQAAMNALEARLEARIDALTLRLTVRLGGIVAAGIGILALIERLH
ncbi:MAG: hypothetical protein QOD11_626 [Bradyrhizobium sp.]|nr:hypothetical protein [Bradyrhizobium sp.]